MKKKNSFTKDKLVDLIKAGLSKYESTNNVKGTILKFIL